MTAPLSADDIWRMFAETDRRMKETDQQIKQTGRQMEETDRQMKETDRRLQEITSRWDKQWGEFSNRLGEFVEEMVRPAAVRLFRERGIDVHEVHRDVETERGELEMEIDLLVVNDTDIVAIEVKSKLTQADVDQHIDRLRNFHRGFPHYKGLRVFGAVAAMVLPKEVGRYAYRKGLFVLAQNGDSISVLNDEGFKPVEWVQESE